MSNNRIRQKKQTREIAWETFQEVYKGDGFDKKNPNPRPARAFFRLPNGREEPIKFTGRILLLPVTLLINIIALGTEFLPQFVINFLQNKYPKSSLAKVLSIPFHIWNFIGRAITSPRVQTYDLYYATNMPWWLKGLAIILSMLTSALAYSGLFHVLSFLGVLKFGISTINFVIAHLPSVPAWLATAYQFISPYVQLGLQFLGNLLTSCIQFVFTKLGIQLSLNSTVTGEGVAFGLATTMIGIPVQQFLNKVYKSIQTSRIKYKMSKELKQSPVKATLKMNKKKNTEVELETSRKCFSNRNLYERLVYNNKLSQLYLKSELNSNDFNKVLKILKEKTGTSDKLEFNKDKKLFNTYNDFIHEQNDLHVRRIAINSLLTYEKLAGKFLDDVITIAELVEAIKALPSISDKEILSKEQIGSLFKKIESATEEKESKYYVDKQARKQWELWMNRPKINGSSSLSVTTEVKKVSKLV